MRPYRRLLLSVTLMLPSLACRAAMQLVTGPQSTSAPPAAATAAPPAPTPHPTVVVPVSCPEEAHSVVLAANSQMLPASHFPSVDTGNEVDLPLVTYDVNGDQLSAPILDKVPDSLLKYQHDFTSQRAVWKLFTTLIPQDARGMLREYEIMTDGPGGVLSAVEQTGYDPKEWVLETDIADFQDTKNLAFTLLHEFGHLLTLGPAQVPPDIRVFNDPDNEHARDRAIATCQSYFPGEGCSLQTSYVNGFFEHYWKDIYGEWSQIDQVEDDERRDQQLHAFYRKHREQFVDSYAVTSPVEDIAETWAFFVLSPRPEGSQILDQKIEFFYGYPELVTLRNRILRGLCAANP